MRRLRFQLVNRPGDRPTQDAISVAEDQHVILDADAAEVAIGVEGVIVDD